VTGWSAKRFLKSFLCWGTLYYNEELNRLAIIAIKRRKAVNRSALIVGWRFL